MRISEAALALITRVNMRGEMEYLTQWNEKWQAYSLIGAHLTERTQTLVTENKLNDIFFPPRKEST